MKRKKSLLKRLFRRKNEPKRDAFGRSQRQMSFEEFDNGKSWADVSKDNVIKPETCRRYYQQWKKLPKGFESMCRLVGVSLKNPESREQFARAIARRLNITPEEVEQILFRPWGLRSLLLARYGQKQVNPTRPESEKAALIRMDKIIRDSGMTSTEFMERIDFVTRLAKEHVKERRPNEPKIKPLSQSGN